MSNIEGSQSLNISWSPLIPSALPDTILSYQVSIVSNTTSKSIKASVPHFVFTAPENAPPCEVYNFSVTATPVGSTYTGDGCSVPSPVLSRMLPSLPDISAMEMSIKYELKKQSKGVSLNIFLVVSKNKIVKRALKFDPLTLYTHMYTYAWHSLQMIVSDIL